MLKRLEESWDSLAFPRRWNLKPLLCFADSPSQPSQSSANTSEPLDHQQNQSPSESSTSTQSILDAYPVVLDSPSAPSFLEGARDPMLTT